MDIMYVSDLANEIELKSCIGCCAVVFTLGRTTESGLEDSYRGMLGESYALLDT